MSTIGSRVHHFRALRRYVARGVIIMYFFLLVTVALTVFGQNGPGVNAGAQWVVWAVAFVPLTGGFVAAVKVLSAADRGRSARLTSLAAGLLLVGIALVVASTMTGLTPGNG
jgi:hypothetical protein